MLALLSVLSRYYFIFLLVCFVLLGLSFLRGKFAGVKLPLRGQRAVTVLFAVFAFVILAFDANLGGIAQPTTLVFAGMVLAFAISAPFIIRIFYRNACSLITNIAIFMLVLGFVMLHRLDDELAMRQFFIAMGGFALSMFIPMLLRIFHNFEKYEKFYAAACLLLLGLVPIAGVLASLTNLPLVAIDQFGATRWISIAGIQFQPSEFAVLPFLLYLATAFRIKPAAPKLIFTGIATALIILVLVLQRNLGAALLFFVVFMCVMYASTCSWKLFLSGFGAMSGASIVAYQIFPHIRVRVSAFTDPWGDIANNSFQIAQSLFAISTFGAFGAGLGRGIPERIPVVERDIIFAAITEEFGWLFGLALIALYGLLLVRGLQLARRAVRPLHALMSLAFTTFIAFQAFVSIGGNIRFIPMTGVTLPFISYGGSSVVLCILIIGVLNWLNAQSAPPDDYEDNAEEFFDENENLGLDNDDELIV
ncbi:MAG: FtsW/RodA/SpoVE family cell cycle protein [Defluviitaleaceae bacterium]|nr:FtsW/RodA/SpoVE family cell cycle protein [Defluviitaleaceae bacterium]